jgi:hypothetical protein
MSGAFAAAESSVSRHAVLAWPDRCFVSAPPGTFPGRLYWGRVRAVEASLADGSLPPALG